MRGSSEEDDEDEYVSEDSDGEDEQVRQHAFPIPSTSPNSKPHAAYRQFGNLHSLKHVRTILPIYDLWPSS